MNVLIIGNGGREHAIAWKIASASGVEALYVAPGNGGTELESGMTNVPIDPTDIEGLLDFAVKNKIDLTIVGPEAPLVLGIVDRFTEAGLKCFGPNQAAAQLEGSKAFTKDFLTRHKIPTAQYQVFTRRDKALAYLDQISLPVAIKADGLAAGKGVILAHTREEAEQAISDMLDQQVFGEAGARIVIEDFLVGEEASFIVMVDGTNVLPLATSQDHKAVHDGDQGPNTGGMGAYSPAPIVTSEIHQRVMDKIIHPTIAGLRADGIHYVGFLYAGLMIDASGNPYVIEFNCRLGDPETQPLMMRLKSDLPTLCLAAIDGKLSEYQAQWDERPALGVVLAAEGYPGSYRKGDPIRFDEVTTNADLKIFHAGTRIVDGALQTNGGRVLCVTALGDTVKDAQRRAYEGVDQIHWSGSFCRRDIGYRAIARERD